MINHKYITWSINQAVLILTFYFLIMNLLYGAEPKLLNLTELVLVLYAIFINFTILKLLE